ncbi:MAG: rhodanese-like domain-containing protein [Candidatus Hodarchaeales archaeon]|jgi:rhodanese-related sulfurtransferase
MENEVNIKEKKTSKRKMARMVLKFVRMYFYKTLKRRWYLPAVSEITVDQLFDRINSDEPPPLLIDFSRYGTNQSFSKHGHIPNSISIPIMKLSDNLEQLPKDKEIVTICPGGGMSLIAVDIMVDAGFQDVRSLTGGIDEWYDNGYPLIKGENISYLQEGMKPESPR